ncbi:hypothetical protein LAJ57_13980, partial [Streptococcus pneumoniae]|uniref:hypothetical protein n=1 Tax=Streptococcus pneumoniae TaxID=1313 RepID=UPI001CBE6BBE
DFSFERGAACVRRGSKRLYSVGSDPIYRIARFYNQPNALSSSPFYVACGSAVYRGTGTTFTSIISAGANALGGFTSYRG